MKSARASAIRIRHLPEHSLVFFCCFSGVNPWGGGRENRKRIKKRRLDDAGQAEREKID